MQAEAGGHRSSRSWLIAGLIFAVVATAVLVLSDDARWLRLGIVAALWAALLGGFLATHYRRQADRIADSMEDAQEVYELELEREIAARREYELEIEADARRDAQDASAAEIDALRSEVAALRETLQKLFGGEVLYERVALTAQSTRMRSLSDDPKPKSLPAAEHRNGELPSVVSGSSGRSYDPPPVERTDLIARVLDAEPRREQSRRQPEPPRREPEPVRREPEPVRREPEPVRREPERPSWFGPEDLSSRSMPARPSEPKPEPRKPEPRKPAQASRNGVTPPLDPADSGDLTSAMAAERPSAPVNRTPPPERRETPPAGGRRRKADPEPTETFAPAPAPSRHAKNDQPAKAAQPDWPEQESLPPLPSLPSLTRMPTLEPEPQPEPEAPAGSHASGRSVAELLAAYGADQPPRRRRRKD